MGVTDPHVLAERAARLRDTYVVTSTFGVGAHFDERLMASLARAGGGNYYYIEDAGQIESMLTSELGEALEIVARRAVLNLDLPAGVEAEVMHEFRADIRGGRMRIELNDLIAGQNVSLIVRLRFPEGEAGSRLSVGATLSSAEGQAAAIGDIAWTFADHAANDAQFRDRGVDRQVAEIYAARARRDAVERNRAADFAGAIRSLRMARDRILSYAGTDPALNHLASKLEGEEHEFSAPMDAVSLKRQHWASHAHLAARDPVGKVWRPSPDNR